MTSILSTMNALHITTRGRRAEGGHGGGWDATSHGMGRTHVACECQPRPPPARGAARWPAARSQPAPALTHDPPALQWYRTALMEASENGHAAVVDALLAAGADPKAKDWVSGWALGAWDDACCCASRAATCHMHGCSVAHVAHGDLTVT